MKVFPLIVTQKQKIQFGDNAWSNLFIFCVCEGFLILVWDQVKGTAVKSRFSYSYDKIKHIYNHQTTNKTTLKVCPKVLIKTGIHLVVYSFFDYSFTRIIHYNSHVLLTYLLIFLRSLNTNLIINHFQHLQPAIFVNHN